MVEILSYLAGPVVGAIIGYITNDIAIRMLFRPHTKKYIFGIPVPFTPGIIPKERARIAEAVGVAISENLMNKEVLEKSLLSEEMIGKVGETFDELVSAQKKNTEPVKEFVCHYLSKEEYENAKASMTGELSTLVYSRIAETSIGDRVAELIVEHLKQKSRNGFLGDLLGGGVMDALQGSFGRHVIEGPAKEFLGRHINEILRKNAKTIVGDLITKESDKLSEMPVCKLLEGKEDKIAEAKASLLSLYRAIISEHLPRILQTLDISKIIEDRINEMDMMEAEEIILKVIKKELNAVVWFGALLGFIIGCANLLTRL